MEPSLRSLVVVVILVACGGKKIEEIPLGHEQKEQAPDAARLEERRKQREAETAAQREAEAAKMAALDAACTLPASLPKNLDKACAAVGDAWDAFMQRRYADDPEVIAKWNESRSGQLPFALTQCKKFGSIEVAACQSNALANLPVDVKAEAPEIMAHCAQKCGKEAPPVEMPQ